MGFDKIKLSLFVLALVGVTSPVLAADVLFVDDFNYNTNIPAVLEADGHNVTVVTRAYASDYVALLADLSAYQVVVWSGSIETVAAGVFDKLVTYVTAGGRVFYTGCDALWIDPANAIFLGISSSADDLNSRPGAILAIDNHLTTGLFDVRGVVPAGGYADRDRALTLAVDTVGVTPSGAGGWNWTLRTLGAGEIAYVSNGACIDYSAHFSWRDTSAGGFGVYNAALRNFVAASGGAGTLQPSTCVATDNGNGSYTIECPDGSSVTITDGTDGADGTQGVSGSDGTDGADGTQGASGSDGTDGADGTQGVSGSDGTDGADGTQGVSGSDGTDGADGTDGTDGVNGSDGSSCMAINNNDGTYTVSCEDGSSVVLADGAVGSNGTNGADGSNGTDGVDGSNGTNGADGSNGTNGVDGSSGTNGVGCTVTHDGAASATIACADGTSVTIDAPEAAGGCSVGSPSGATSTSAMVLGALGVLFVRRRKA